MTTGRFLALEGADGAGKTTLAYELADLTYDSVVHHMTDQPDADHGGRLVFIPRRQISATSQYGARLMDQMATMLWHSGDSPDLPDSFWVALQAAWFTAHATTVIEPVLTAGFDVIVDGWIYKFFSKLLLQGYHREQLNTIFARVRTPDAVVLLTADPATLYDRGQGRFRPAELGMHAGYDDLGRSSFIEYQAEGQKRLRGMALAQGWLNVHVDAEETAADTAARLIPIITDLRRRRLLTLVGGAQS